jgi:predicted DNA binding CopG/RHH family protein
MAKKVTFGTTPAAKPTPAPTAEEWVEHRDTEPKKRLTIDISPSLHRRIKTTCARRGVNMADEIRELLETHFRDE